MHLPIGGGHTRGSGTKGPPALPEEVIFAPQICGEADQEMRKELVLLTDGADGTDGGDTPNRSKSLKDRVYCVLGSRVHEDIRGVAIQTARQSIFTHSFGCQITTFVNFKQCDFKRREDMSKSERELGRAGRHLNDCKASRLVVHCSMMHEQDISKQRATLLSSPT